MTDDATGTGTSAQLLAVVADDDELIRTVVQFAVESLGITVLEASTGAAAVALVREHPVDLVIVDIHFPGETFKQVWDDLGAARFPRPAIIVLSGDAAVPAEANGPSVEFLRKPVELGELQAAVARLLRTPPPRVAQ
jgi:two-component system cell cycle sensor histidine kinase/response regulator CckA